MFILSKKNISRLFFFIIFLTFALTEKIQAGENLLPTVDLNPFLFLIHSKKFTEVLPLLEQAGQKEIEPFAKKRVLYLLAYANLKQGNLDKALEIFTALKNIYPELSDYIQYNLGKTYLAKDDRAKAMESFKLLVKEYPDSRLKANSEFELGKGYFELKEFDSAAFYLNRFVKNYPNHEKFLEALFFLGETLYSKNKLAEAFLVYQDFYLNYPLSSFAMQSQERIAELRANKDLNLSFFTPFQLVTRIEILLNNGRMEQGLKELENVITSIASLENENLLKEKIFFLKGKSLLKIKEGEGEEILNEFVTKYPKSSRSPEILYLLGKHFWDNNKNAQAITYFEKNIEMYPVYSNNPKTLYVLGRINQEEGNMDIAVKYYSRLIEKYLGNAVSQEGAFRIGWIYFQQKKYSEAISAFQLYLKKYSNSEQSDSVLYWLAINLEKAEKKDEALKYINKLIKNYPYSYYSFRGREKLVSWGIKKPETENNNLNSKDKENIFSELDVDPFASLLIMKFNQKEKFHFEKLVELTQMEFFQDAKMEAKYLPGSFEDTDAYLLWLSNLNYKLKDYLMIFKLLNEFLGFYPEKEVNLPWSFWEKYYPLFYMDYIKPEALAEGVDPYLILGIIRQESAFNPLATSMAGAKGLMQLMNETGASEFKKREDKKGVKKFDEGLLYDEQLNIELGIQHFASLQKLYQGNFILSLVAYNAGKSKAEEWVKKYNPVSWDEFVETIPFAETRGYVKKVLRNYWNYQRLYGVGDK